MHNENSRGEIVAAGRIVNLLLSKGYKLSVYNGEEWACKQSTSEQDVMSALGETGEDTIRIRSEDGDIVGGFYLVWGNCPSGVELICDYSYPEPMQATMDDIWDMWTDRQEAWAVKRGHRI